MPRDTTARGESYENQMIAYTIQRPTFFLLTSPPPTVALWAQPSPDVFCIRRCHRHEANQREMQFCSSKHFSLGRPFEFTFLDKELGPEFSQSQCPLVGPGNRILLPHQLQKEGSHRFLPLGFRGVSPSRFFIWRSSGKSIAAPEHMTQGCQSLTDAPVLRHNWSLIVTRRRKEEQGQHLCSLLPADNKLEMKPHLPGKNLLTPTEWNLRLWQLLGK